MGKKRRGSKDDSGVLVSKALLVLKLSRGSLSSGALREVREALTAAKRQLFENNARLCELATRYAEASAAAHVLSLELDLHGFKVYASKDVCRSAKNLDLYINEEAKWGRATGMVTASVGRRREGKGGHVILNTEPPWSSLKLRVPTD